MRLYYQRIFPTTLDSKIIRDRLIKISEQCWINKNNDTSTVIFNACEDYIERGYEIV